jgi:hypothetical protein
METFHHKPLKKFSLDGNIHDDSAMWRLKTEYMNLLVTEMKIAGYVPRLDINADFTVEYNSNKEYFEFQLSMYGIYVGKRKSEWIIGIDETKVIYTQKSKSNESSQAAESPLNPK